MVASERIPEADAEPTTAFAALLDRATVTTPDGRRLLGPVSLAIRTGEHWAVLGGRTEQARPRSCAYWVPSVILLPGRRSCSAPASVRATSASSARASVS